MPMPTVRGGPLKLCTPSIKSLISGTCTHIQKITSAIHTKTKHVYTEIYAAVTVMTCFMVTHAYNKYTYSNTHRQLYFAHSDTISYIRDVPAQNYRVVSIVAQLGYLLQ